MPAPIVRFTGPVRQVPGPGPFGVTLLGQAQAAVQSSDPVVPAQLSLIGVEPIELSKELKDLTVEASSARLLMMRSGTQEWRIHCRTWQLHRDVGTSFYAAVPPRPTPWTRSMSWRVLLGIAATAPGRWLLSRRSRTV